jgi:hypothetical protein
MKTFLKIEFVSLHLSTYNVFGRGLEYLNGT